MVSQKPATCCNGSKADQEYHHEQLLDLFGEVMKQLGGMQRCICSP